MADEHTYYLRQRPLPVSVSDQSLSTVDTPISSVAVSTSSTRLDPIPTMADPARSYVCSGYKQIPTIQQKDNLCMKFSALGQNVYFSCFDFGPGS